MIPADFERVESELTWLLRHEAGRVRVPGASYDDQLQEARIGLWKATRDFDPTRGTTFKTFAALCIRRQLVSMLKAATRGRQRVLSDSVRVVIDEDGEPSPIVDALLSPDHERPEEIVMRRETLAGIGRIVRHGLSPLEREVLALFTAGASYEEIAAASGCRQKTVDNALQRSRRKVGAFLEAEAA